MNNIISIFKKNTWLWPVLLFSHNALAAPSFLGLTINQTTISELKKQYYLKSIGHNPLSHGHIYEVQKGQITYKENQRLTTTFNKSGVLIGIEATFPKRKFDYFNNYLSSHYELKKESLTRTGDKSALYRTNDTQITITALNDKLELSINYQHNSLVSSVIKKA